MGKKRCTHEEYIKKVKAINPHIEIIGKYTKARESIKWRCMIHDITDESRADTLLNKNKGCIHCYTDRNKDNINIKERGVKSRKSHEQFIKEMNVYHPDIKIIGLYEGNNKPIECECLIDGYCWSPTPHNLLGKNKTGCPICGNLKNKQSITKSHNDFIKELQNINDNIIVLGEYINSKEGILCKCKECDYEWSPIPDNLLSKHSGCPKCNLSKGELAIAKYLDNNNIDFDTQYIFDDCKCKEGLPFDFYLPQYNYCIEFDGEQHYKSIRYWGGLEGFIERKIRDTIKNYYCQQNNIKLIRIPYWDFDNIENILKQELNL